MSDAIEKVNAANLAALGSWTSEQKDLIKRTCAKDATDDELSMFLHIAARSGLDPLRRQIHFMKYQGRVTIVADVNGLQARAAREADFEGILHAVVYAKDTFLVDNVTGNVIEHRSNPLGENGAPVGAWATVKRRGMLPFTAVVRFNEYRNDNNPLWKSKPAVMIDKCAKSTALRLAYPEQLGSIYDEAELGKEERDLNPPPAGEIPKKAADVKAALAQAVAAKAQVEDAVVVDGPTEEQKAAGVARWNRVLEMGKAASMTPQAVGGRFKMLTGKTKPYTFTDEDVEKFRVWLEDVPTEAGAQA